MSEPPALPACHSLGRSPEADTGSWSTLRWWGTKSTGDRLPLRISLENELLYIKNLASCLAQSTESMLVQLFLIPFTSLKKNMINHSFLLSRDFSFSACTLNAGFPLSSYTTPSSWAISYCVIQWPLFSVMHISRPGCSSVS